VLKRIHNHVIDTAQLGGSPAVDLRLCFRRLQFYCMNVGDLVIGAEVSNSGLWSAE
jgi:hypothetical protein